MHHPTDRIVHTTTAFVTPVVEHWLEQLMYGSTMQDRSNDLLHHEWALYQGATSGSMTRIDPRFHHTEPYTTGLSSPKIYSAHAQINITVRIKNRSHGGPIELFLILTMTGLTKAVLCDILSVGWCIYKRTLAANQKE